MTTWTWDIPEWGGCRNCGTWVCAVCGWSRHRANLAFAQDCARCLHRMGTWYPTRHRYERSCTDDDAQPHDTNAEYIRYVKELGPLNEAEWTRFGTFLRA